ncbi:hypothetical protein J2772_001609 [Chryseobacterium jejuense]|nr:hypothetical protein [Chryseobacterium jejuense]
MPQSLGIGALFVNNSECCLDFRNEMILVEHVN